MHLWPHGFCRSASESTEKINGLSSPRRSYTGMQGIEGEYGHKGDIFARTAELVVKEICFSLINKQSKPNVQTNSQTEK